MGEIEREQRERDAATTVKPSLGTLLKDRQIMLFCALYFCIQLTIYAATFWLPSIIKKMGDLSDIQVGFLQFHSLADFDHRHVFVRGPGRQVRSINRRGWPRRC